MEEKLIKKVEFERNAILHESGVKEHSGAIIGPKFYVLIRLPDHIVEKLGEEAVESGYEPGEKVKYKITIERID